MGWLVLTVLFGLVGSGCLVAAFLGAGYEYVLAAAACVVVWLLITLGFSFYSVGQREVGVQYNFAGAITGQKGTGWGLKAPWTHIQTANVGVLREDFQLDESNAAVSLDQQPIFANLALNYQVEPQQILKLYKTVGPSWKQILLDSRVLQDFKEVTAKYTAAQITTKRPQLRSDTKQRLIDELSRYDIKVVDFFVSNLGYTQSYRDAINAKNVQVQQALQAQAKVAQSTAEANQEVAKADGDRRAAVERARGNAEANRLIARSITDRLIELRRVDALNHATTIYVPANWTAFGNLQGGK